VPKLPTVTARETLRAIQHAGWQVARQSGSHVMLEHPTLPGLVVIPMHARRTLKPGTLRSILNQAGLSVDRFLELL
jgi:predicted RNA binding protein YcfA (HicA-like mRNA interferase family)